MIAPLFDTGSSVLAIPVGVAFGVTLERAGLGSARTIADQLRGRDFTVIKVMFAAIVTAMLGVFWASKLGWLDLSRVAIPATDLVPQAIGAVLFGAGFAVAALCPGTACVSVATGKRDGLMTIVGLFAGTLVVSLLWSALGTIAERAPNDHATLPADLGLPAGLVVAVITVAGILTIALANRIVAPAAASRRLRLTPLATTALVLGGVSLASGLSPASSTVGEVSPRQLATWLRDRNPGVRVVDVRDTVSRDDYRIPGAEAIPAVSIGSLARKTGDTLVLYGDGTADAANAASLLGVHPDQLVLVLHNGMSGWESDVMSPRAPDPSDSVAVARFQPIRELAAWFGGKPTHDTVPPAAAIRPRRKRTC